MPFEIQEGSLEERRRWQSETRQSLRGHERKIAIISCPKCGEHMSLAGHQINGEGHVRSEVSCPYRKCGFRAHVRLVGWET